MIVRFIDGIRAQPHVLGHSATRVREGLAALSRPDPAAVVALVGIGASEHAARSAALAWRGLGIRAFGVPSAELIGVPGTADVHVALSESGQSAETVRAAEQLSGRVLAVTNDPDSPLATLADRVLLLGSGPDTPVYTTGYTATLQALGLLGEQWAGTSSDWSALPDAVSRVLETAQPVVARLAQRFEDARMVDVVASGTSTATAGEGALLLRESSRLHTAAHETYNYLHGPMEPLDESVAVAVVGDGREVRLARDLAGLGCPTLLLTCRVDVPATDGLTVITLPAVGSPLARAAVEIVPLQLLGAEVARRRGLAVDGFRYPQDDTKLDRS